MISLPSHPPPHAPEAEMALLGAIIIDRAVLDDVLPLLPSGDRFYAEAHAAIYDAMLRLHEAGRGGDLVALTDALRTSGHLEELGGVDYLVRLAEQTPSSASAPYYARTVADRHALRRMIDESAQNIHDCYSAGASHEEAASAIEVCEQRVFDAAEVMVSDGSSMGSASLSAMLDEAIATAEASEGCAITGVASGFADLDAMTAGLQPGEMIVIAARPSMGKTALALNLAEQIAFAGHAHVVPLSRGSQLRSPDSSSPDTPSSSASSAHSALKSSGPECPVAVFSMEMSRQAITQRMLCARAGIDSHRFRTNRMTKAEWTQAYDATEALRLAPLFIDDTPSLSIAGLRARARRMHRRHTIGCIIIDYLQLMTAAMSKGDGRQQEVSAISRGVKAIARDLGIPVIVLSQLNRQAEQREGHRPRMSDLRESGSIEQDADVVMLLHREDYYHVGDAEWAFENPDKVGVAELIIAKQRNGPTGVVTLTWDAASTRFRNHTPAGHGPPTRSAA